MESKAYAAFIGSFCLGQQGTTEYDGVRSPRASLDWGAIWDPTSPAA